MESATKTDAAIARTAGVLFIVATAAAVAGDMLVRPIRDDSDYLSTFATLTVGGE